MQVVSCSGPSSGLSFGSTSPVLLARACTSLKKALQDLGAGPLSCGLLVYAVLVCVVLVCVSLVRIVVVSMFPVELFECEEDGVESLVL